MYEIKNKGLNEYIASKIVDDLVNQNKFVFRNNKKIIMRRS